jgi:23S rRNA-/tRNA-specific pseudouridylate synthase
MAHLGHPLVGDGLYGSADDAPRHMLHARAISFEEIEVVSPEPADFAGERAERIAPAN